MLIHLPEELQAGTGKDIDKKQSVSMALQESVAVIPYVQLTNYSPVRRSDRSSALVDLSDDASGAAAAVLTVDDAAVGGVGIGVDSLELFADEEDDFSAVWRNTAKMDALNSSSYSAFDVTSFIISMARIKIRVRAASFSLSSSFKLTFLSGWHLRISLWNAFLHADRFENLGIPNRLYISCPTPLTTFMMSY